MAYANLRAVADESLKKYKEALADYNKAVS
jgi:hypothetical protein